MKRISSLFLFALLLAAASCSAGESYANDIEDAQKPYDDVEISVLPNRADVVVTIKRDDAGVVFFQYGSDRLFPGEGYPFDGQCRAIGAVTIYAEEVLNYGHRVSVNWLEPIDRGDFLLYPTQAMGADGLDVLTDSWITSVEDGYLTIHYKTWWGEPSAHHDFVLVQENDPYELTLLHDAHGDGRDDYSDGTVYFDINTLPPTDGSPRKLKINWTSTDGKPVSAEFEFETRI